MDPILALEDLCKTHPKGERPFLFSGVTAIVKEPQIVAVLGASGQGKTSLFRIIALLDPLDGGEMRLQGKPSSQWKPTEWRSRVAYVAQQPVMLPGSIEENLRTASRIHQISYDRRLAAELMESIGLGDIDWKKKAISLSGGEKQRVALVRTLLLRPQVLLLDEVTSALDTHSKNAVESVLVNWNQTEGAALLWATHDLKQARLRSNRVWFMAEASLLEDKETETFFCRPFTRAAQRYLQIPSEGEA
jgi:putative ABC transport system ATP-binding protein